MAVTYLNNTTLAQALNREDTEFNVTSTANITVGNLLLFANEVMKVRAIPVAGRVNVRRGYEGTHALAHRNAETFYIGTAGDIQAAKDSALGIFGSPEYVPNVCIPGTRGVDANGYEYILVDIGATGGIIQGATIGMSKDGLYTASVLTTAFSGSIGVLVEDGTSNQWCWALIKGYHPHAKLVGGSSLVTSTGLCLAASSVSTPSVGLYGVTTSLASSMYASTSAGIGEMPMIHGMWPASAASTASTSATSETGLFCAVWLQYPYMDRKLSS